MPYKLYNRTGSGGFVVEAALALAGQPCELVTMETQPRTPLPESFREINPWRQVPVLIADDGLTMTETAAILIYIANLHPGDDVGPMIGTKEYTAFLRWIVFLSVNVYEGRLRWAYPERYTSDENGAPGIRSAALERNAKAFTVFENELQVGKFLLGSKMSVADVYLAMLFAWHRDSAGFARCEALTHRIAGHPVVAPLWQRNFDHRMTVKWGR